MKVIIKRSKKGTVKRKHIKRTRVMGKKSSFPKKLPTGWVQTGPINLTDLVELSDKPKTKNHILELTSTIKQLLYKNKRYRDDDQLLCTRVQKDELRRMKVNPKDLTVTEFFKLRENHIITCEDTITRLRRKCQQEYPNTRGKRYKARQNKMLRVVDDMGGMTKGLRNYSRRKK